MGSYRLMHLQTSRKTNFSYPLIYIGTLLRNVSFSENFANVLDEYPFFEHFMRIEPKSFTPEFEDGFSLTFS